MRSAPSVSVVIPTYNGSAFIGDALGSVFAQTHAPREIIVVDDASSDGTPDLVDVMARESSVPLRLIRLRKNSGGPAHPMNVGIEAASGDLIAVCDQDDIFLPDKLREQAGILTCGDDLSFAFGLTGDADRPEKVIQGEGIADRLREAGDPIGDHVKLSGPMALHLLLSRGNFVLGYPGFLFRRDDWRRKGGLDEGLMIASDYDLLCWLAARGPAAFIPRVQYLRRSHAANATNRVTEMSWEMFRVKSRHLPVAACDDLRRQHKRELLGLAYWAREAHQHRMALRCLLHWIHVSGPSVEALGSLAKLVPHWAYCKATRRPPVFNSWTMRSHAEGAATP